MSFRDIKGQDKAIAFLRSSAENKRITHAYIFAGPDGVGKFTAAVNFAKAINCRADAAAERPCDACTSCKKIDSSNHPDVFVLKPEKEGKSIGIDGIREVIRRISLKPYEAEKKVVIINDADAMTIEAANSLLKTLEEPAGDTVLILIAENTGHLLSTIASRAQIVKFFPLSVDETCAVLAKEHGLDETCAHILARFSSGSIGRAARYKEEDFFNKRASVIQAIANRTFFNSDFDKVSRTELKLHLDIMLTWYRDVLVAKSRRPETIESSELINADRISAIQKEAALIDSGRLDDIIKEIIQTGYLLDHNANAKLAMSVLGLKMGVSDKG